MKRLMQFSLAVAMVAVSPMAFAKEGPVAWRTAYGNALSESQQTGKMLVICVSTTWCGPCRTLKQTTLSDPRVAAIIEKSCIPLALDGDQNQRLVQQLGVTSYPTQIFATPDGKIVARLEGMVDVSEYSAVLTRALDATVDRKRELAAAKRQASAAGSSTAANSTAPERRPPPEEQAAPVATNVQPKKSPEPLALDGSEWHPLERRYLNHRPIGLDADGA